MAAVVGDADGVMYVPALLGLGTPHWDFGARGTLLGVTRAPPPPTSSAPCSTASPSAASTSSRRQRPTPGSTIEALRVDGGMSANPTFVQALADLSRRPVEVSPVADATTLGAAFLAGLAVGMWDDVDEAAALWRPRLVAEPAADRSADRAPLGRRRRHGPAGWIPELSALDF